MNSNLTLHSKLKVAIVGANGYAGCELAKLLLSHVAVDSISVFSRNTHWHIGFDLPDLKGQEIEHHAMDELNYLAKKFDVVFLATPPDVSMQLTPGLIEQGIKTIDLSGAFRLKKDVFEEWYKLEHTASHLLETAQYGLCPWQNYQEKKPSLIANPGCFATCTLMAVLPLIKANLLSSESIIIDAKSGVSGAGKKGNPDLLYCEIDNNFYPYKIGHHQHTPEIANASHLFCNTHINPTLVTHLLPLKRGLSTSIYATLNKDISNMDIHDCYENAYKNYPLIKHGSLDQKYPQKNLTLTALKHVIGSARTHIAYQTNKNQLTLFASIDNLLKGAASQAIENLNLLFNFPIETGLTLYGGVL
jgi:N-acetyl-gamma-glutamyl-phosphate reductase